jgi:hypothetical protein
MSKNRIIRNICLEIDVFEALEKHREGKQHVRSMFINEAVREKLKIPRKVEKKGEGTK